LSADSSSADYQSSSAPIEPRASGGRRLLFGCLIAAGVVIAAIIVSVLSFRSWLRTPGALMEPGSLLDANTVLYAELHLRAEDPGVREFFIKAVEAQQEQESADREVLPGPLRSIIDSLENREDPGRNLERVLPVIVALLKQEEGPGVAGPPLFAVSLPKMGNRLRFADIIMGFIAGWAEPDSDFQHESYGEEVLYHFGGAPGEGEIEIWASLVGSDVLVSKDPAAVKAGIDRLSGSAGSAEEPPGSSLIGARPEGAVFYMATREGGAEEAAELIEVAVPAFGETLRRLVEGTDALKLWAFLTTSDLLEGELWLSSGGVEEKEDYSGTITAKMEEGEVRLSVEPLPAPAGPARGWAVRVEGLEVLVGSGLVRIEGGNGVTIDVE
jgi:hypothetical protein